MLVADLAGAGLSPRDSAYASIVWLLTGFMVAILGAALIAVVMSIVWGWQGHFTTHRHAHVVNVARFLAVASVIWLAGLTVLYLGPVLT